MAEHTPACTQCAPCIAQVSSPEDRLSLLRATLARETEPLVALTHLLRLCRDEHRMLWEHRLDAESRLRIKAVQDLMSQATLDDGAPAALSGPVRVALVQALQPCPGVPAVVVAQVLAGFLDEHYGGTFWTSFARRSPYQPAVGDPVPLDSPDLRTVLEMRPTSPPWRLAQRLDETRHVRLAGGWATRFRVVFDYSRAQQLSGILTADTTIAVVSPNASLRDFDLGETTDQPTFPVRPRDEGAQRAQVQALVQQAVTAGASIIVLPELAVSAALACDLQSWVRRPGGLRLLVAGSHHADAHDGTRRRNTAVAWLRGSDAALQQDKHSPADRPVHEDLHYDGWPELRVHVSRDGWHLALAVCRDLLNPSAVQALAEAGVNLLLVPSMSETLLPFGGPAAQLVGANQALVAVGNGPANWAGTGSVLPVFAEPALFGHPGLDGQTRLVHSSEPDPGPGIALLHVGSAIASWSAATAVPAVGIDAGVSTAQPGHAAPRWVQALAAQTQTPTRPTDTGLHVSLRRAAVLVLLSEGSGGVQVLLTRRSAQLRHHPGVWVLPGGSAEPQDDGSVATALREAQEEVGIDARTVQILGTLPTLALADGGWVVEPVVGWTADACTGRVDPSEVSAWENVSLGVLSQHWPGADQGRLGQATEAVLDLLQATLARSVGSDVDAESRRSVT